MRRPALLAVAASALVAGLVLVGNWERGRRADAEADGMRSVVAAVGALDSPSLRGFRIFVNFECLVYRHGRNRFALELCVDDDGRVVEAIDRRSGDPSIWSLRDDPTRSTVTVDRAEVNRLLRQMNVPERYLPLDGGDA